MHRRELESFLKVKVGLEPQDRKNHRHFQFPSTQKISLPTVLAVSHGDGEVALVNLKGLAKGLGLQLHEFQESSLCHISGDVVTIALAVHLLGRAGQQFNDDPPVYREGCRAMAESVSRLLHRITKPVRVRRAERHLLERLEASLRTEQNAHLSAVRTQLQHLIGDFLRAHGQ